MKKVLVLALALCAMTTATMAQEPARECKKQRLECRQECKDKMAQELNLTPEQVTRVEAAREEMNNSKKQARGEMREAREKFNAEMKQILTPEQQKKMEEMKAERPRHHKMRDGKQHCGAHKGMKHAQCVELKCQGDTAKCVDCKKDCKKDCADCKKDCKKECKKECVKDCKKDCKKNCADCKKDCKKECKKDCKKECKKQCKGHKADECPKGDKTQCPKTECKGECPKK